MFKSKRWGHGTGLQQLRLDDALASVARSIRLTFSGYDERLPEFVDFVASFVTSFDPATLPAPDATFLRGLAAGDDA